MADLVAVARRKPFDVQVPHSPIRPAPDAPSARPGRFGDLGRASVDEVAELAAATWPGTREARWFRQASVRQVLGHLADFPGGTWTQRWLLSGLDVPGNPVAALGGEQRTSGRPGTSGDQRAASRERMANGLRSVLALRVVTPSLGALRSNRILKLPATFRTAEADPLLDSFFDAVDTCGRPMTNRVRAQWDITCVLLTQNIALRDLTAGGLLHYATETARLGTSVGARTKGRFPARTAWELLVRSAHFPPSTPHSLQACLNSRQSTAAELVDRYEVRSPGMRQLLIDYLERRRPDCDYSTWTGVASRIVGLFWSQIEQIAPDQGDLHLPEHVYQQWRAALGSNLRGGPRSHPEAVLQAVRGFYIDLQLWAVEEPERWAQWVAPSPVPAAIQRAARARQRRVTESTAARTRERQPLLPRLVDHLTTEKEAMAALLEAARPVPPGSDFVHQGVSYRRSDTTHDRATARSGHTMIRVVDPGSGLVRNLTMDEDAAFWAWACVETMRHSGVRIEELLELTQLSIRQYQRPNGEIIALLVVAPSKNDRERVVPMSAQLLHVIASIMRRHATGGGTIPVTRRYDPYERAWSPPLPFLFQRRLTSHGVLSYAAVRQMLNRTCTALAATDPAFGDLRFTPHDFRRLFATELVNTGLPIHIGAQLLGHLDLQTTRGYVAVFEEDLIRHYQSFMARRRERRPQDEYRQPDTAEWTEFQTHFDRRKVELGTCARPYGTPCHHEHACIRCPMLDVDPRALPRLVELETDLEQRKTRAMTEGWLGELEGLDLTLRLLRDKRSTTERVHPGSLVSLGMPAAARSGVLAVLSPGNGPVAEPNH